MNNKQHIEFTQLLLEYRAASYELKQSKQDALFDFIDRDFTPKTVEDGSPQRTPLQQLLEIVEQKRNGAKNNKPVKDALSFVIEQTIRLMFEDAHAELDSLRLIKGMEEKMIEISLPCPNCACVLCSNKRQNAERESQSTPNRENYREEKPYANITISLYGNRNGSSRLDIESEGFDTTFEELGALYATITQITNKQFSAIDKEVKSNPASE